MCDIIDLGVCRFQKEERTDNNNTQGDATLPEFLQGGIDEDFEFVLTNTETGRRAHLIGVDEIEEIEEAKVLDLFKPES